MPQQPPRAEITPDPELPGGFVVEAPTASQALGAVQAQLGSNAVIVAAERVLRGGIRGFFAREVVRIRATPAAAGQAALAGGDVTASAGRPAPRTAAAPTSAAPTRGMAPAPRAEADSAASPVDRLLRQMSDEAARDERSFSEVLRAEIAAQASDPAQAHPARRASDRRAAPVAASEPPSLAAIVAALPATAAPVARPLTPASRERLVPHWRADTSRRIESAGVEDAGGERQGTEGPRGTSRHAAAVDRPRGGPGEPGELPSVSLGELPEGAPNWSVENLLRLGLPALVVDAVRGLDPSDDLGWVQAIASAVATLCRPLPGGSYVVVGPRAGHLAGALGKDIVEPGETAPPRAAFCVQTKDSARARGWLSYTRGSRWLHLVVGGTGWRGFLFDEPLAVSWSGLDALPETIRLAAELGLVLGYGVRAGRGREATRAAPADIALDIRTLLCQP